MKKSIAIIGSGPSALLLAAFLDDSKFDMTIYEKNFAPSRKFLVAGDGGFNLTHSENIEAFIKRYTPVDLLEKCLRAFSNTDLCDWLKSIGIETGIGSSKRVFPAEDIKPIDVLNSILKVLEKKNVRIKTQHEWKGWKDPDELMIDNKGQIENIKADHVVFALGGSSWSKTGSDGGWSKLFSKKNILILPFQASNCSYQIKWDQQFLAIAEGKSLKNISISCTNAQKKGEVVITKFGMEGGAVYALSPQIRDELNSKNVATIFIDLKPDLTEEQIQKVLSFKGNKSFASLLKSKLNLSEVQIALLKTILSKEEFTNLEILAVKIKKVPIQITGTAPIDDAISTVGGVALQEVDEYFQLKKLDGHYAIGEMLDWDAPTGGYLLQACFSMGVYLAKHLNSI